MAQRGSSYGMFVPTTQVWDVAQLEAAQVDSPEFKELLVRLYQNVNTIALVLNKKDSAYYDTNEFVNGQLFFPNPGLVGSTSTNPTFRQVFRKVIDFGVLPNAGIAVSKSMPHGIVMTPGVTFTRIYATGSDTVGFNYIPIPYASPVLANAIQLDVDATNIIITTGAGTNRSNFNKCYVVVEWLKS